MSGSTTTWESWFQTQNVDEVRRSVGLLETQIRNKTGEIHRNTGERYPDMIALSERLESLKMLGTEFESRLVEFGRPKNQHSFNYSIITDQNRALTAETRTTKVKKLLLSIAQRSLVQKKYPVTARCLYFLEALGMKLKDEGQSIGNQLNSVLDEWMAMGSFVSQMMFDATLVHLKLSPASFITKFLEVRRTQIAELLKPEGGSLPAVFKAVDSALFVYNQVKSDWGNTRLSQRSLIDTPEFASAHLLQELVAHQDLLVSHIRAYPDECYERSEIPTTDEFLKQVGDNLATAAPNMLAAAQDGTQLLRILRDVVLQAENSLCGADSGILTILSTLESPFTEALYNLIDSITESGSWVHETGSIRSGITQLSKLARSTKSFAPDFSAKLTSIQEGVSKKLEESLKKIYKDRRQEILGVDESGNMTELANQVSKLLKLNSTYTDIGGMPEPVPTKLFSDIARSLIAEIEKSMPNQPSDEEPSNAETAESPAEPAEPAEPAMEPVVEPVEPKKTITSTENDGDESVQVWGEPSLTFAFRLQLLMDEVSIDSDWNATGIEALREALKKHVGEAKENRLYQSVLDVMTGQGSAQRSSLLLSPFCGTS